MNRREFVGAAASAALLCGLRPLAAQAPRYDLVIKGGRVIDPSLRLDAVRDVGIAAGRIAWDPGIGFGKSLDHNVALLRHLKELRAGKRPLVLGVSRKSLIARLLGNEELPRRRWPTVALTAWLREEGADVLRVHDVLENAQALRMIEASRGAEARTRRGES